MGSVLAAVLQEAILLQWADAVCRDGRQSFALDEHRCFVSPHDRVSNLARLVSHANTRTSCTKLAAFAISHSRSEFRSSV